MCIEPGVYARSSQLCKLYCCLWQPEGEGVKGSELVSDTLHNVGHFGEESDWHCRAKAI